MQDRDLVRPHVADGIEEYDNPMPRWWLGLFFTTIVFGGIYLVRYHLLGAASLEQAYSLEVAAAKVASDAAASTADSQSAAGGSLAERMHDPAFIGQGKEVFQTNCAPCHGALGEGNIGPNLTDDYWLHGAKAEDIIRTIGLGAVEKGMPPWAAILGDRKVEQTAAFILSLRGTNPPKPKAPQGTLVEGAP